MTEAQCTILDRVPSLQAPVSYNRSLSLFYLSVDSWCSIRDPNGAYLIDRSPVYFEPILNYLRHGHVILDEGVNPRGVLEEAKFFGLTTMIEELEETVKV